MWYSHTPIFKIERSTRIKSVLHWCCSVVLLLVCIAFASSSVFGQEKVVVTQHDNGAPEVVVYLELTDNGEKQKVKEEVYYHNGQLEHVGHYKDGLEHGNWIYFGLDGKKKYEEYYENGLEEGIHYDYALDGSVVVESHYKNGKMIKSIVH